MGSFWSTVPKPIAVVFIGLVYSIFRPFFQKWLELNQTSAKYIRRNGEKVLASYIRLKKAQQLQTINLAGWQGDVNILHQASFIRCLGKDWKVAKLFKTYQAVFSHVYVGSNPWRNTFRPDFILWSSKVGFCKFKSLLPVSKRWSIELPWN